MKINKPIVFIVLTILLLIFGAYYVLGITFQNDITPEDVWQISQTNGLRAEINWQLRIPCLRMVAENPNKLISSVGTTVAVHRNCLTHSREVIALNSVDGNVLWRTDVFPEVYMLKSDSQKYYGLEGDRIVSFDSNGQKKDFSSTFVSRSVRDFFVGENSLYVPFRTSSEVGTYVFDVAGNGIVDTQRFENISNVSGERIITIDANRVRVLDTNFGRTAQANIEATSSELEYADLNDDVLVVFEERFGLLGYDVGSGLERWSISTELDTFPIVEDGKIYTLVPCLEAYDG